MASSGNVSLRENVSLVDTSGIWENKPRSDFRSVVSMLQAAIGIVGNLLFILALRKEKKLRTTSNYLIAHLCVVDFLTCAVVLPGMFVLGNRELSFGICEYVSTFFPVLPVMSMYAQLLIAVNRYYLVTRPRNEYLRLFNIKRTALGIVFGWTLHMISTIVLFVTTQRPEQEGQYNCSQFSSLAYYVKLVSAQIPGYYILYFVISVSFYVKLHRYVRRNAMVLTTAKKNDSKLSSTLLQISVLSVLLTLVSPLVVVINQLFLVREVRFLTELGNIFFYFSFCVNPFFYGYKIKLFRETLKRMLNWKCQYKTFPQQVSVLPGTLDSSSNQQGSAKHRR